MNSVRLSLRSTLALLWKEWRLNRWCVLLLAGASLAVAGVRLLTGFVASHGYLGSPLGRDLVCTAIPLFAAALLGARAYAGERVRGTQPFLDSLPPHRAWTAALKAILPLLWLAAIDLALLLCEGSAGWTYRFGLRPESYLLRVLSGQLIIFGVCLLSSALNDRPLRAAFMAPVLLAALYAAVAVTDLALFVVLIDRSIRLPAASGINWGRAFDLAPAAAGAMLLAAARVVGRLSPHPKQRLALVCTIAASLLLLLLPAAQVFLMWGDQSTHFFRWMVSRFELVESSGVWGVALLVVVCIASAVWAESRGWRHQGIPTAWAGVGAVTLASGSTVILGWAAVMLCAPDWSSVVNWPWGAALHFSASPDGAHVLVVMKEETLPCLPVPTPAVLLTNRGRRGVRIPCQMSSAPMWSPSGRFAAWKSVRGGILSPRPVVAVLDTKTRRLHRRQVPGRLPDYRVVAGWPADQVWDLVWDPASDRVYLFSTSEMTGLDPDDRRVLECVIHTVSPKGDSLECDVLAKWRTSPSRVPWGLMPAVMDVDPSRRELLVFTIPDMSSIPGATDDYQEIRASGTDATALYRIDLRTGQVTRDPALEALKRESRGHGDIRFPSHIWLNCYRFHPALKKREMPDLDLRSVMMVTRSDPSGASQTEYWSLGSGGSRNCRLVEDPFSNSSPRVFLDETTSIEARSRKTPGSDEVLWDIVKSRADSGTEEVLLATWRADSVALNLSPGRRWLTVSSQGGCDGLVVATDASCSKAISVPGTSLSSQGFWAPDGSAFLWMTPQGLTSLELGSATGAPGFQQQSLFDLRRLIGGTGSPIGQPCVSGWTAYMAWNEYVLCRTDLQGGKGEVILKLGDRGTRWVETGTFRLDDLEDE